MGLFVHLLGVAIFAAGIVLGGQSKLAGAGLGLLGQYSHPKVLAGIARGQARPDTGETVSTRGWMC